MLGSSPWRVVIAVRKLARQKNIAKNRIVCFGGEISGNKATAPKPCPHLGPNEDGFRGSEIKHGERTLPRKICLFW